MTTVDNATPVAGRGEECSAERGDTREEGYREQSNGI
jgi:hypothetical protein